MAGQENITFLKRKIIGVDKLVKNKEKTDARNKELTNAIAGKDKTIAEKDAEIANLKAELLEKVLATSPKKSNGCQTELEKELEETRLLLEDKTIKVAKFKEESVSRSQKIGQLEIDLGKKSSKLSLIEKELEKKNRDIIKRELESQELKKNLEELKTSNANLEDSLKNGLKIKSLKQTYEERKWKDLAEISSLKQENAALEKKCTDLTESHESMLKKNNEYINLLGKISDKKKNTETLEKQLDKKEKSILNLEKKLEKAIKENEKLRSKLDKKGIHYHLPEESKEAFENSFESDMGVSDADTTLTDIETEIMPPSRKTFSFSFSRPNARFQICKPTKSNQRIAKVMFRKKSSVIENLPVILNANPSISDSLPNLTFKADPLKEKPRKRKQSEEQLETPSPKKRLKLVQNSLQLPDSTSPPLTSALLLPSNHSDSPGEPLSLSSTSCPLNQSTPHSALSSSSTSSYSNSKQCKQRIAHNTKSGIGITPMNVPHGLQEKPLKTDKRNKASNKHEVSIKSFPTTLLPQELSPIKSPSRRQTDQLPLSQENITISTQAVTTSAPQIQSSTAPATARARILASSLAPQAVEAQIKVAGGKLSQAQLDAAKRRAIPSVTHTPSVNGFRQSANESKSVAVNLTKGKVLNEKKKPEKKPLKTNDELLYCPSRRRTNPSKVSSAVATIDVPEPPDACKSNELSMKSHDLVKEEHITERAAVSLPTEPQSQSCHVTSKVEAQEIVPATNKSTRQESLDGDLDISDSDDDKQESVSAGLSVEYQGEEKTAVSQSSNEDLSEDSHGGFLVRAGTERDEKENVSEHFQTGSDDGDTFDGLISESKPLEVSQPKKGHISPNEEYPENAVTKPGKRFFSQLEELRHNFQSRTNEDMKKLRAQRDNLSQERSCFAYDAYVEIIKKHFRNWMGCQNEESFNQLLDSIANNKNPQNEAIICDLVYEYLKTEHRLTPLLSEQDDNQPAITRKQQRLFVLLTKLIEKPRFQNIMDRMLALLWHNLFGRDRMFNHKLNAVENSGRMFVLCARYTDSVTLMKHFIYDLFYFRSPRNHILVGIVIALWPEIFPHRESPLSTTPLSETISWCIFNTGPAQKSPEMKVQETKDNYVRDYDYKPNAVTADSLVLKFIKIAEERSSDKELLEEVAMCLLLIGRNKEFRWVNNNISARLLKSLASVWGASGDQSMLRWVLITLGLLSRVYPAEGREQIKSLHNSVEQMLQKGSSLQPETENTCIRALLHLGYHLQVQVAQLLKTWQPAHSLDPEIRRLLEDFVGTRGKKHAEITARVGRIEHNKARKRKGVKRKQ